MIYFDNNATTQALPEVQDAVTTAMREWYANPSSIHQFGQLVRHRVELAREQVARLLGATSREIVFTGGGTESINLAIRGALAFRRDRRALVTTAVEHSAVLKVCEQLALEGYEVRKVGVDREGQIDVAEWARCCTNDVALATIMHANNETGVLWDVRQLADPAVKSGALVHVDAVQSAAKLPIDVSSWNAHLVSLSAHKFHGPKGVGALYIRRRTRVAPLILGGTQEMGLRGGTENVEAIVGMGVAAEAAMRDRAEISSYVGKLRDRFEAGVIRAMPIARVVGGGSPRVYNTANIAFAGLQADAILLVLSEAGVCASAGAACSSGSLEPSHVLKAMGVEESVAHGAIRFSFSKFNTQAEVDGLVRDLPQILAPLVSLIQVPLGNSADRKGGGRSFC